MQLIIGRACPALSMRNTNWLTTMDIELFNSNRHYKNRRMSVSKHMQAMIRGVLLFISHVTHTNRSSLRLIKRLIFGEIAVQKALLDWAKNLVSNVRRTSISRRSHLELSVFGCSWNTVIRLAILILATLGFVSFTTPAFASVGVWTYAGQNYPTQATALAAMHAVSARNALLTVPEGATRMGTAVVTYKYGAPNVVPGPITTYCFGDSVTSTSGGCDPSSFNTQVSTEQGAINNLVASLMGWGTLCSASVTVTSGWMHSANTGSFLIEDYETLLVTETLGTDCSTQNTIPGPNSYPQGFVYDVVRWQGVTGCPAYYVLSGTTCIDSDTDSISYRLLECPANGSPSTLVGDPCDVLTGDFSQTESDYSAAGLSFQRYYHSATLESNHALGMGWTHNYAAYLVLTGGVPTGLFRPNGHHDAVTLNSAGEYISLSGASIHVQASGSQWIASLSDGSSEVYDSTGRLIQRLTPNGLATTLTYNSSGQLILVTGPFGHSLQFTYNANNQIQQVTDPNGQIIAYTYDNNNNLTSVTRQDASVLTYLYENSTFPNNLTGIVDESNRRLVTIQYDPTTGAVISSQQSDGGLSEAITYSANGAVATDGLGGTTTFTFTTDSNFAPRVTSVSHNNLVQSFTLPDGNTDPQRRVTQSSDANGNVTTFTYDNDHLTTKTEAFGTPQARSTSYQYLATNTALPTLVTEPLRKTSYTYYTGTNNVQTKTITDSATNQSRTWTYSYNTYGQVLTVDGPRTDVNDVTTYAYYTCTSGYQCGQVQTVTDALGHVTTYTAYNAAGQPLTITDPNGVVTTLTYDARARLTSRSIGGETTSFSYWPTGLLKQVMLPDGSYLSYTYDAAHRLTQIQDTDGNKVVYTLDAAGNHTAENLYDPSGTLKRTHTKVFNALSQLYQDINAANTSAVTTTFGYDSNGNQTTINAPLTRNTSNQYDALNRLTQVTDPAGGITKYQYDANANLVSVTDPRNLQTTYIYNGLGDLNQQVSPDTGTTLNTYDSAGNLTTRTDARGQVTTFQYDALNRITQMATADQTLNYQYDQGTNGIGHLTTLSDANHTTTFAYDARGRVTQKSQTQGSISQMTQYAYTNGDLTQITTPSGQVIAYSYANGKVTGISFNGTTVLNQIQYDPFGPITQWTWGNGTTTQRSYDQDGYLTTNLSAGTSSYTFNPDGSIASQTNDSSAALNLPTGLTTFSVATNSNQLTGTTGALTRMNTFDAAGNLTSDGTRAFTFNGAGRMTTASSNGLTTNYTYNAQGQRIKKANSNGTTYFTYEDISGHLLGTYNQSGSLTEELIWLGNIPVASIRISTDGTHAGIFYIHTDHLNAPRKLTNPPDNSVIWRWDSDPYGNGSPNLDPDGDGLIAMFNGRTSEQVMDQETGLNYNLNRDYDPVTGRYVESDPIGLRGGINTYSYVNGNPIALVDPSGLVHWDGVYNYTSGGPAKFGAGVAATGFTFVVESKCVDGKKARVRVDALAGGLGTGISLFGPLSVGASTVSFEDSLSFLNPNIFEGDFSYTNAGTFFGSVTTFALGGAIGDGSGLNASTSALDISGGRGKSHVTWVRFQDCGCDTTK